MDGVLFLRPQIPLFHAAGIMIVLAGLTGFRPGTGLILGLLLAEVVPGGVLASQDVTECPLCEGHSILRRIAMSLPAWRAAIEI